ncbi:MAG: prenyltransferase/squalene oxidase repeat-containing protein [Planctomycetota bacterium]|jgi:squalene-hopene/tetraprenyl-beta-curcumene cyclase
MDIDKNKLENTLFALRAHLIESREQGGYWSGELSSSALATATAVFALAAVDKEKYQSLIEGGFDWLASHCNSDGGWGDTPCSVSNISTTTLCWSAFAAAEDSSRYQQTIHNAELWLTRATGSLEAERLVRAINEQYGKDRTFSSPILTMCALAGRLGPAKEAWKLIKPLPFEFAALPHSFFRFLRLPVVSYALPALIAIGLVNFRHRRPANPVTRLFRHLARRRTLSVLQSIQPEDGGFLEAITLTSFVVMSLCAAGESDNKVVSKGINFILNFVRKDGSWPTDTTLATWVTTLSINALAVSGDFEKVLAEDKRKGLKQWLLGQQYQKEHLYTHAASGGWSWTDLPGGVPDADDTAGALIALRNLGLIDSQVTGAVTKGVKWLLGLQNRDGGIPTFCRGWANMPFDRSAPELTAHAMAAMDAWFELLPPSLQKRAEEATCAAIGFMEKSQRQDGAWLPLWFGNQLAPEQKNLAYGTAKVLIYLNQLTGRFRSRLGTELNKAAQWLLSNQNEDGGWGGVKSVRSSIEETSLAVDALAGLLQRSDCNSEEQLPLEAIEAAVSKGVSWLITKTKQASSISAVPIGLYFAKLWYYEKLYPWIFAAAALQRVYNLTSAKRDAG